MQFGIPINAWWAPGKTAGWQSNDARSLGRKVVLVAGSNRALRTLIAGVLRERHYDIIEASDGAEAVRIGAHFRGDIHLLVTNVRLPDLLGWELGELLRLDHPALGVVCIAGSREDYRCWRKNSTFVLLEPSFERQVILDAVGQELLRRPFHLAPFKREMPGTNGDW